MIVEFVGIARTGKTTVAKYLEKKIPDLVYYPERHDLVPKEVWGDDFKHNYWYAKYCVDSLETALAKNGIQLFERGVVDRLVIGNVYYKMNLITKEQHEEYENLLNPQIKNVDKVFVFLIPVMESVERAAKLGKDVTKAIPYMNNLYEEYKKLSGWFTNCVYLPENASIEELEDIVKKEIGFNKILS